ncbi:DUF2802 domain-containing protein [Paraglaciecola aquimarina]|uniref:DUF2802 domain-containing protein n=1 Tax=Paraglaciecola algarum TaxID=3050085 RepID=A0ABS9DB46_9ALTE|nr:DUF2802 domain-containing protein [Paraglaciecola sp. G1-23]MCF2950193.1 DUF2802 domain-containing protein [Paraglaciecola sp. G1-23]
MDLTLIISILALGFSLLGLFAVYKTFSIRGLVEKDLESQKEQVSSLIRQVKGFSHELDEVRSATYAMVNRIKQLESQVEQVKLSQQEVVEQDPQSRFYSKGVKLVSQGASIEELMQECDMPLAEAELLFNLHNKQN